MIKNFKQIEQTVCDITNKISIESNKNDLQIIKQQVIGRNGILTKAFTELRNLSKETKIDVAKKLNNLRDHFLKKYEEIITKYKNNTLKTKIDTTIPSLSFHGVLHPFSNIIADIKRIMFAMGFNYEEGPSIENEYYNFEALNISSNHSSRDSHDTFYLYHTEQKAKKLLRTHTTSVQIRALESEKNKINGNTSLRIFSIGDVYRRDDDATHAPMFHQFEGLLISQDTSIAELKGYITRFLVSFFEVNYLPIRFRPHYFPFTEPSIEVDIMCYKENDKLKVGKCSNGNWMEILGAGMISRNILDRAGYDNVNGFAFGMGIERLAMLKLGIQNLHDFVGSSYPWIMQYGV